MLLRTRGFTLIELLVVIAIIAILAAVLFPVMASTKAKALQTSCAQNMRQLTMALLDYAEDYEGTLPGLLALGKLKDADANPNSPNRGVLWKYIRTKQVYVCPADSLHRKKGEITFTYTMNGWMTWAVENRAEADYKGAKLSIAARPTRAIFLVDENTDVTRNEVSIVNDFLFIWKDRTCDRHPGRYQGHVRVSGRDLKVEGVANITYVDSHIGTAPGLLMWDQGYDLFHEGITDIK